MQSSTEVEELKICINCKYILGKKIHTEHSDTWQCHHPNNIIKKETDLVTGNLEVTVRLTPKQLRYDFILTEHISKDLIGEFRDTHCGREGTWYEEYIRPDYTNTIETAQTVVKAISTKKSIRDLTVSDL